MDANRLALFHLAFTLAMVGLMTAVQLVIYPQFRSVPATEFTQYVSDHGQRITYALALFAPAEVLLALFVWLRAPDSITRNVAFIAGALLAIAWVATAIWYGPLHGRLIGQPYDAARIDQLILTNWARTFIWWARGGLAVWLTARILDI